MFSHSLNEATQLKRLREIFVLLISDRRMARLHRQFLNKAGPTDVLTFEHGEIFISVERARDHAVEAQRMERMQRQILAAALRQQL